MQHKQDIINYRLFNANNLRSWKLKFLKKLNYVNLYPNHIALIHRFHRLFRIKEQLLVNFNI